ncbi:MAG TPA: aldo/keto reductase family protein [Fimbriimonadaceae bacterium]|nr:aldo/keto reductase family protein [Fimbriimonadaceae bacterium]
MNYRRLGRSSVKVSEVAVGGWLTHGRSIGDDITTKIVKKAFDLGINFFDTADVYNAGEAEKALAKAIKGIRRDDIFVATKCFFPMSDRPNDRGLSRKHIVESVHNSLKRLETDYVDLMQCHRWDPETRVEETVRAMDDLIRQGKILYWGVSEWRSHQIAEAVATAEKLNAHKPVSNQPNYSMLQRYIEESVLPTCDEMGLGQVVFSPLAQGALTGKYKPGQAPPAGTRGADEKSNMFMGGVLTDEVLTRIGKLEAFAKDKGAPSLAAFALAWCLRNAGVSSVIIGATRPEQVEENAKASGLTYDNEVWTEAEAILAS